MKKLYVGAIALACSLTVFADETESVMSFSLVNLTQARMNASYTDSKGNVIAIETSEPKYKGEDTFLYRTTTDNPLRCVNQTPAEPMAEYAIVAMKGNLKASYALSPAIQITLPSSGNITAIQLLGFASGGQSGSSIRIPVGFSEQGTNESAFKTNWDETASDDPAFSLLKDVCTTDMNNKRAIPAKTKYVKMVVTADFGDLSGDDNMAEVSPLIYAIRFFAKDTPTSIEGNSMDALDIELLGRNLQLGELADVVIYDFAGRVVAQYANVDNAYLDYLNEGLYVVKATTENGVAVSQKIVVR